MNAYPPAQAADQNGGDANRIAIEFQSYFEGRGLVTWWLKATSGGWRHQLRTTRERDTFLRGQLCSVVLFVIVVIELVLLPTGLNDVPTLEGQLIVGIAAAAAILCNRKEWVTAAGIILVIAISVTIFAVMWTEPAHQLSLDYLPSLALYMVPAIIAGMLLTTYWAFVILAFVLGTFMSHLLLQPLAPDAQAAALRYGWIGLFDIELIVVLAAFFAVWFCAVFMRRAYAFAEVQIRRVLDERQQRQREQLRAEQQQALTAQRDEFVLLLGKVISDYAQSPTHGARVLPAINNTAPGSAGSFPPTSARGPVNLTQQALSIDLALSRLRSQLATAAEQEQAYLKLLAAIEGLARDLADVRVGRKHVTEVLRSPTGVHEYNDMVRELVQLVQGSGAGASRAPGYSPSVPTSPTLPSSPQSPAPSSYPHAPQPPIAPPASPRSPAPGTSDVWPYRGEQQPGQPSPGQPSPRQDDYPDLVPDWLRRDSNDNRNDRF